MTKFCQTPVRLTEGLIIVIDGNSKITARDGSFAEPQPNAFSLPAPTTCVNSTSTCRAACYVIGLRERVPDLAEAYEANLQSVFAILAGGPGLIADTARTFGGWIDANRQDFRWHVSGDVFSVDYARWIRDVCRWSPGTRHWIYTRSLFAVPTLVEAGNLTTSISADRDNYEAARRVADLLGVRLCYLATGAPPADLPRGSVIFPDYSLRGRAMARPVERNWWQQLSPDQRRMVCPADFFGQSERRRCGPCSKCLDRGSRA